MKKLLLLGNNSHVDELIKNAKERGVHTIVTDNLSIEQSPVKAMADEAWNISVLDYDALEEKCKAEAIDGILCGASEVCIKANKDLCERLNLPFYANQKAWDIANDKIAFKKACEECGLPVAKEFHLDINLKAEDIKNISYPVVVKPADGCSSIGLHICHNEAELIEGYKDAYEKSDSSKVVVEEYVAGEQVGFIYAMINGVSYLNNSGDDSAYINDGERRVFGAMPTKHMDKFETDLKNQFEELFKHLEIKNGILGIQTIFDGKRFAVIEMNYRLPGGKVPGEKFLCEVMLDNALGEDTKPVMQPMAPQTFSYAIWLKPGRIAKVEGLEVLQSKPREYAVQVLRQVGDEIQEKTGMRQIYCFIMFFTDLAHQNECIDFINDTLKVFDENGEDMMCHYRFENGYAV